MNLFEVICYMLFPAIGLTASATWAICHFIYRHEIASLRARLAKKMNIDERSKSFERAKLYEDFRTWDLETLQNRYFLIERHNDRLRGEIKDFKKELRQQREEKEALKAKLNGEQETLEKIEELKKENEALKERIPRTWWRILRNPKEGMGQFIFDEIKQGRLRQGWGYDKKLDLDVLIELDDEEEYDEEQYDCWINTRRMHQDVENGMEIGDYVLVHNTPENGYWTVVEITGNYSFSPHPDYNDYGHIREVTLITPEPIKFSEHEDLSWALVRAVQSRRRLIELNSERYEDDFEYLEEFIHDLGEEK